jgi:hypothetical protein
MPRAPKSPTTKRKPRAKSSSDGIALKVKVSEETKPISTGGRPSWMNVPEYHDSMCALVMDLGRHGYSECEISAEINVPRTTMRSWCDVHPVFSSALTRAKELEQAFWEKEARTNLKDKDFNANLWNKSMAARFRAEYGDKIQLAGDKDNPIQHQVGVVEFRVIDNASEG